MIYIRTDANEHIATGHVMRNITVAEELRKLGEKVTFVISDDDSKILIEQYGYDVIVLFTKWNKLSGEFERKYFEKIILKTDKMIVDTYYATSKYLAEMKKLCKVIWYDDLYEFYSDVDLIINYNIYYELFDYGNQYKNKRLLLGEKFVPLREQFYMSQHKKQIDKINNIMLICGGGDKYDTMGQLLDFFMKTISKIFNNVHWIVIAGNYNRSTRIKEIAEKNNNVEVLFNVKDISKIMEKSDLCISAASTVLYECCAMNLPTIFYCVADNQKYDAEFFSRNGMMIYSGNFVENKINTMTVISEYIKNISENVDIANKMIKQMEGVVDGRGANRIAMEIKNL